MKRSLPESLAFHQVPKKYIARQEGISHSDWQHQAEEARQASAGDAAKPLPANGPTLTTADRRGRPSLGRHGIPLRLEPERPRSRGSHSARPS
jgi:hypothetical protein